MAKCQRQFGNELLSNSTTAESETWDPFLKVQVTLRNPGKKNHSENRITVKFSEQG